MKTIDDVIQKLEYIMESDPRTFSNPECEYEWVFRRINESIKMLKEIESDLSYAQPRMKGKWKTGLNENGVTTSLFCSECNYENKHWYEWNFCPHCGADMREEVRE